MPTPAKPTTALEGTYTLKSEAMDGRPAPAEWLNRHKAVVIDGDRIIVRLADGTEHTNRFKLDGPPGRLSGKAAAPGDGAVIQRADPCYSAQARGNPG